jgi:hypothetical protein
MDVWGGNATTWTLTDSQGNVAFSGDMAQTSWPGDVICGLSGDECYTFEANDTFDGWIYINLPNGECDGCTTQLASFSGNDNTSVEFCMPPECDDDQVLDNLYSWGYSGFEDVEWTITNLLTGEVVGAGGVTDGNSSTFMCFDDGVYELSACDEEDEDYDDWSMDIWLNTSSNDDGAYINTWNMTYVDGVGCDSDIFGVNMQIGCMDPDAMNYNPYAEYQTEESCMYPCPEESFILMQWQVWSGFDGDETWEITDDDTGEIVLSGMMQSNYDCEVYCGDLTCLPPGCYTMSTSGEFDGYVNISEPSPQCSGCTNWIGDVWSNSTLEFCIGSDCEEGEEEIYTYGYNVGAYTITYDDGTVLEYIHREYTNHYHKTYQEQYHHHK